MPSQNNPEVTQVTQVTQVTPSNIFEHGVRDDNLFHIALSLAKSGECEEYITQVLLTLMQSWGEYDEKWASNKVKSAFDRLRTKERNLTEEIRNWVKLQTGNMQVTSSYMELHLVTKEQKNHARVIFGRLCEEGLIERVGQRSGEYRLIEKSVVEIVIDDIADDYLQYPLWLPFELHSMVDLSEGNIVLIAGEFNAGKTAWMMNILKKNKDKIPIRYMSSEMWRKEFKKRFGGFHNVAPGFWNTNEMTDYIYRSDHYADALRPGALNIIDYLEIDDYSTTASVIRGIHDKLQGGVCIICVQKKKGEILGRGKDMLMEKPRLAISLYGDDDGEQFTAHITKAKIPIGGSHDGKKLDYLIKNGCIFEQLSNWTRIKRKTKEW